MIKHRGWMLGLCGALLLLLAAGRSPETRGAVFQTGADGTATPTAGDADTLTPTPSAVASSTAASLLPQAKLLKLRMPVMGWLGSAAREDWWAVAERPASWYYCEVDSTDFEPQVRVEVNGTVMARSDAVRGSVKGTVSWTSGHEAWAYVVVSPAFRTGAYTLACSTGDPSPGAAATPSAADAPAQSPLTSTATLVPITWQAVATPSATPVVTQIELRVYYDANGSLAPDAAEGVGGLSVRVLDEAGQFVGWAITDDQGQAELSVTAPDVAGLYIPFLNWRQVLTPGQLNTVLVRVEPVSLPEIWPAP